ncbi:hypothetical protein [Weissella minor]|uniref:hypothetical protein n=1 Tax=Weissella minor TaxID=1620 RepID=UPI003AF22359
MSEQVEPTMDYKTKIDKTDVLFIISSLAERLESNAGYTFLEEVSDEYPDEETMMLTEKNL